MNNGFTLVEILIVMALIGILVAIIIPNYSHSIIRAKEAVLKENLFQIRDAINKFYLDKKKYPTSLEDLVTFKYLPKIPVDPMLNAANWQTIHFEPEEYEDYDPEISESIIDVRSRYQGTALDGSKYEEW
jgi:general secretion pathway protein G